MKIGNFGVNDINSYYNSDVTRLGRAENVKSVSAEATMSIEGLSDVDRAKGIGFLNNSSDSISSMQEKKYPNNFLDIFKMGISNFKIANATAPRANDNEDAAEIKKEYKDLANEINKELAHAKNLVGKLGEGQHELTDKSGKKVADVNITKDKEGNITVDISNVDGSKTKVSYNENKPNDCRVDKVDKEGNKVSMGKGDTTCEKTENGVLDRYSLGEKGSVVKETEGPGEDDYKKSVVNKDGSTDNYDMIYKDDNGEPVFEHTQKPPKSGSNENSGGIHGIDISALKAVEQLNKENPNGKINADQMEKLIISGTEDADGNAAGKEYSQLKSFVTQNWNRLEDDAKAIWNVYENCVRTCKANGEEGIPQDMYEKMKADMSEIKNKDAKGAAKGDASAKETNPSDKDAGAKETKPSDKDGSDVRESKPSDKGASKVRNSKSSSENEESKDASATKAIEELNRINPNGEITAQQIEKLILDATGDADGEAAGKEYEQLLEFVEGNWNRLSDDAKAKWNVYENYARSAMDEGRSGIYEDDYNKMIEEMQQIGQEDAEKQM